MLHHKKTSAPHFLWFVSTPEIYYMNMLNQNSIKKDGLLMIIFGFH